MAHRMLASCRTNCDCDQVAAADHQSACRQGPRCGHAEGWQALKSKVGQCLPAVVCASFRCRLNAAHARSASFIIPPETAGNGPAGQPSVSARVAISPRALVETGQRQRPSFNAWAACDAISRARSAPCPQERSKLSKRGVCEQQTIPLAMLWRFGASSNTKALGSGTRPASRSCWQQMRQFRHRL